MSSARPLKTYALTGRDFHVLTTEENWMAALVDDVTDMTFRQILDITSYRHFRKYMKACSPFARRRLHRRHYFEIFEQMAIDANEWFYRSLFGLQRLDEENVFKLDKFVHVMKRRALLGIVIIHNMQYFDEDRLRWHRLLGRGENSVCSVEYAGLLFLERLFHVALFPIVDILGTFGHIWWQGNHVIASLLCVLFYLSDPYVPDEFENACGALRSKVAGMIQRLCERRGGDETFQKIDYITKEIWYHLGSLEDTIPKRCAQEFPFVLRQYGKPFDIWIQKLPERIRKMFKR